MSFEGKSVVVTGGARGIGSAIVKRFAREGAFISILDLHPETDRSGEFRQQIHIFEGDVGNGSDVEAFVKEVMTRCARVDILINNAGIIRDNVIWRMPEEDFDTVVRVNLKGSWLMCRQIAPHMRQQMSGRIVNIASRAWLGNVGQSNYSSSKGGLISLTRVLALELAKFNVTVNAIAPGLIDTPLTRNLPAAALEKLISMQPGGRIGKPEDIANAAAFLASDDAQFITGQVLHVDGGKSIGATVL